MYLVFDTHQLIYQSFKKAINGSWILNFWCYPSGESCLGAKRIQYGSHLIRRPILGLSIERTHKFQSYPLFLTPLKSPFSKLLSKRAILAFFFAQCVDQLLWVSSFYPCPQKELTSLES